MNEDMLYKARVVHQVGFLRKRTAEWVQRTQAFLPETVEASDQIPLDSAVASRRIPRK